MTDKNLVVPDYLKSMIAQPNAEADSMASSSMSIPRVSLRGRKFRLIVDGEEVVKPSDELDAVILAVEPQAGLFIKTFYEGTYNPSDSTPPTCASSDGIAPDGWVTSPQSNRCSSCPKNVFGSATSRLGKKAKACKDSKRIWLALPGDIEGTVFAMGVPITSLKGVAEYGRTLKTNGYPVSAVVTRITMIDAEFPQLHFEMKSFLPEETGRLAIERNISKDWDLGVTSKVPMLEDSQQSSGHTPVAQSTANDVVTDVQKGTSKPGESIDTVLGNW
jgi:hypothetical protein